MNGGELIGRVLNKQDVRFLFTLSGGHIAPNSLILFGGGTTSILKGRGALQDIDQIMLLKYCS